jgi:hypothetical protein
LKLKQGVHQMVKRVELLTTITLRVPNRVKKAAEKAADDDHRSMASLVEKLLIDHLKGAGYLKK